MKTAATIDISDALTHLHIKAENIERIGSGCWSEAFTYKSNGELFVIRISHSDDDFYKDQKLYHVLHAAGIPVPQLFSIGSLDSSLYYAISARCSGSNLTMQPVGEKLVIELFKIVMAMHKITVSHCSGWGLMDRNLKGWFNSWNEFLLRFYNQKMDYQVETLVANSLLSRELYEACITKIKRLLLYLPKTKNLVHGDYGFDNVIADGDVVTGVVDWGEAKLGDWLYDVAYLDFNSNEVPYGKLWNAFARKRKLQIANMEARLLCYKLVIGLGSVAIAAYRNDVITFKEDMQKLEKLVA